MGRGVVSSRVTLLLRSAEIKPYWSQRSPSPLQSMTSGCVDGNFKFISLFFFFPPLIRSPYRARRRNLLQATGFFSGFALLPNLQKLPYVVPRARRRRLGRSLLQTTGFFSDSEPYSPLLQKFPYVASSDISPLQLTYFHRRYVRKLIICKSGYVSW